MRSDMFQVLLERPRYGHHTAPKLKTPKDDRSWMPVSRGRGTKQLNENLSPLLKFLRRSVGRRWNSVFAEISENLNVKSAVQKHVRDHLKDLVKLHLLEREGELWILGGFHQHKLEPGARDQLYVCPRTGLLRVMRAQRLKDRQMRQSPVTWVRNDLAALVFRDQWWLVTVRPIVAFPVWDVLLQKSLNGDARWGCWQTRRLYGKEMIAGVEKRALTRAEAKKLGLKRGRRH